jgi:hypothetical protein
MKDLTERALVRTGGQPVRANEFAAGAREVIAAFYRREFLRASRSPGGRGAVGRHAPLELLRNGLEMLILPGFLWVPQLESRRYFRWLREKTERLRRGVIDHLELELAMSVAAGPGDAGERSRAWVEGMKAIHAAFGGSLIGER